MSLAQTTMQNANDLVTNGYAENQLIATEALDDTKSFVTGLSTILDDISSIPEISEELGAVTSTVSAYIAPAVPVEPDIVPSFATAPAGPVLDEVGAININQDAPTFNVADPVINEITPPVKFSEVAPTVPLITDHVFPNQTEIIIPDVPVAREIILPDNVELMDFLFDGVAPGDLVSAPDVTFNYQENPYSSTLLDGLNAKLLEYVNQQITGLDPTIEQQLWDRGRERTNAATQGRITQITRIHAASGWGEPIGSERDAIDRAIQDGVNADIGESRNIVITQANLIQQKFHHALTISTQLETALIAHSDNAAQRAFEAARYTIQAAIDLHSLLISEFNTKAQVYQTHANVFKIRVDADIARLEQQKIQLEAQSLISEINQQDIDKYKVEIESLSLIQQIYNDALESVRIKLEADRLKIQTYEGELNGFKTKLEAKSLEYQGYRDEQQGELLKATTHKTLADVFDSKMRGYEIFANTQIAIQDSEIKVKQELPLEVSKVLTEIFNTANSAEEARLKSLTDIYKTRGDIYGDEVSGEAARVGAEVSVQEQEVEIQKVKSEIRIESLKGNISSMLAEIELALEAMRTGATVSSQLAASAFSAVNLSAGIDGNASFRESQTGRNKDDWDNITSISLSGPA